MTKLSRRAFFRGAGAVAAAAPVAALSKLPLSAAPPVKKMTIRMGLPKPQWRKLHEGVQPSKAVTRVVDLLNEHNEILDDLPYRKSF